MHNFARMCGRVYVKSTLADMVSIFQLPRAGRPQRDWQNVGAPSQWDPIITLDELTMGSMMFVATHWGFMTRTGGMVINARSAAILELRCERRRQYPFGNNGKPQQWIVQCW
jgi:hypothetical protein